MSPILKERIDHALNWACDNRHDSNISDEEYYGMLMLKLTHASGFGKPTDFPSNITEKTYKEIAEAYTINKNKLQAVKLLKDATGWGLREAKDYCDNQLFPYLDLSK